MAQAEPAGGQAGEFIDTLDAPAAAGHAAGMLARLAEREAERTAAAEARAQAVAVAADPRESVDRFLEDFAAHRQQLEAELEAAAAGSTSSGGESGGDGGALAPLLQRIVDLEKAVADAAYFLPAYDLRQATLALAALRERQEVGAAALQPRRRFAFNRKAPKAAAAAAAGAAPAGSEQQHPQQQTGGSAPAAAVADGAAAQPPALGTQQQQLASKQAQHAGGRTIRGLRDQVLVLQRADAAGQEFTLSDLEGCTVYLLAPLAGLFLHGVRRCSVYTGPVAGACFVEGAEDCTLMIAARQVRIHAAHRCDLYLRVRSHPIIEHSTTLRFAPYAASYGGSEGDLADQGLEPDGGMWSQVHDFGWLRATQSPHWSELPGSERVPAPAPPADAGGASGGHGAGGAS